MKKILSLLASLTLTCSATSVVSCNILSKDGIADCFDEFGKNVTTEGSENYQWSGLVLLLYGMSVLPSDKFPDSETFKQLDGSKTKTTYRKGLEGEYSYEYTLLLTTYDSVNAKVVNQMKEDLADQENGIYVFLNLPNIDLDNIKNEPEIDFQFLFLIKKDNGEIVNNDNNSWVFWYDCQITNDPVEDGEYFFNFQDSETENRVVTADVSAQAINEN